MLIGLCATGAVAITPFAVTHLVSGRELMGVINAMVVLLGLTIAWYVWFTRNILAGGIALASVYMSGILASMYIGGPSIVYWMYPAMAAAYFFVPLRWAIGINVVAMAAMAPVLGPGLPQLELYRVIATLAVLNVVACLFARRMIEHRELLTSLATRDPLTGSGNRRALETRLREMVALHERRGAAASMLVIDVDFFKRVNDGMGHGRGDGVLVALAEVITERIRLTDGLYRYGGDEFVVLLNETGIEDAARFAEQLRELIERSAQRIGHRLTVSLGVAELADGESEGAWLQRADVALYEAKHSGRNASRVA